MSSRFTDPERRKGFPRPGDWWVSEPRGESGSKEPWLQGRGSPCSLGSSPFTSSTQSTQWALVGGTYHMGTLDSGDRTQPSSSLSPPLGCSHPNGGLSNRQAWGPLVGLHQQLSHCRGNQPEAGFPPWRCQWTDSCEGRPWPPNWLQSSSWRPQAGFKSCLYGLGQIFWLSQALVNSSIKDQY